MRADTTSHLNEKTYDVFWDGPLYLGKDGKLMWQRENEQYDTNSDSDMCLYAVYTTHALYGPNSLVYIGQTERDINTRIKEHDWWTSIESYPVSIHVACIGEFDSWANASEKDYPRPDPNIIDAVESLLILAHQPAYNKRSKSSALKSENYRIFNSGQYGSLLPEVSWLYYSSN